MSYVVWLYVENEDEADSDPSKAWWILDRKDALPDAIDQAETIVGVLEDRLGIKPGRLDDDTEEEG